MVRVRVALLGALALAAATLPSPSVSAEECPAPSFAPEVAGLDARLRLATLSRAAEREVHDIDLWSWSWGGVYTAGALVEGVGLAETSDHGKRIDLTVGVASTAFGAVSLLGLPLQLTLPLRSVGRHVRAAAEGREPVCAALARAEHVLESAEKVQALGTGPATHLGNLAVNAAFALILGLGYHRWPSAALSAGIGVPIGEANAFTQPAHLTDVLAHYRSGQLDGGGTPGPALAWSVHPTSDGRGGGAVLTLEW